MFRFPMFRFPMNLQLFAEGDAVDPGVESASAAETQVSEIPASQTGVDEQAAAEPDKQNNFEKAFAKKLAAEREKWDAEVKTKYGDYDTHKEISGWLQEQNGMDVITLKEQIELERLNARADREQVSPEVIRRIDELEAKAAKGDALEQQVAEEQRVNQYKSALGEFAKSKGIESDALNQFMIENQLTYDPNNMERSFTIAFKAMDYDGVSSKMDAAKKDGVKEFLQAKGSIPSVPGNNAQGQVVSAPPKTFAEARARAMQRMTGDG